MKKTCLLLAFMLMAAVSFAQKPVVYCDYFVRASDISASHCEQVRSAVISGINDVNRVQLIDVAASEVLQLEEERRQSENAMADNTARTGQMVQMGAEYILYGYVSQCSAEPTKGTDGVTRYSGVVSYTVKIVKAADGSLLASKDYTYDGFRSVLGDTSDEAITGTLKAVKNSMNNFINEHFKLKAVIIEQDYVAKKKKDVEVEMEQCYVTLGTDHGVEKGQRLDVSVINIIAGRETKKVIGALTVEEVMAGDLSLCKVTKGGEEIMTAMKEYIQLLGESPKDAKPLEVTSKKQSSAKSFLKGAANSFGF